jgi:hypothetical protein
MSTDTPPDPVADASDVRDVIATDLGKSAIDTRLADAAFDNWRANDRDLSGMSDALRKRIEKNYAAYLIRATRDRDVQSGSWQSVSLDYDGSALDELRRRVRDLDPTDELLGQEGVTRRSAGGFDSARPHARDGIGDRGPREG